MRELPSISFFINTALCIPSYTTRTFNYHEVQDVQLKHTTLFEIEQAHFTDY